MPELNLANSKNNKVKNIAIIIGASKDIQLRLLGLKNFKDKELVTTETELKAMANPANSGLSTKPTDINTLAAMGMPTTL